MKGLLVTISAIVSFAAVADPATYTWQGSNGGAWNDPANWVGNKAPNGWGATADLSSAIGDYTITMSGDYILSSVKLLPSSPCNLTLQNASGVSKVSIFHDWGESFNSVNVAEGSKLILDGVDFYYAGQVYTKIGGGELCFTRKQANKCRFKADGGTVRVGAQHVRPLVHYTFDDAENPGKDSGTLGKNLTNSRGSIAFIGEGRHGGCVNMQGASLWADSAAGLPSGDSAFTVSLWVKDLSQNYNNYWWCWGRSGGNYYWQVNQGGLTWPNDKFYQFFYGASDDNFLYALDTSKPPYGNDWAHVVLTSGTLAAGQYRRLYINGVEVASHVNKSGNVWTGGVFGIGIMVDENGAVSGTEGIIGSKIDDYMIFDCELTAAQVQELYQNANAGADFSSTVLADDATIQCGPGGEVVFEPGNHESAVKLNAIGRLKAEAGSDVALTALSNKVGRLEGPGSLSLAGEDAHVRTSPSGDVHLKVLEDAHISGLKITADDPRLVAYWKFDDPTDYGKDSGPNGMTLVPENSRSWSDLMSRCTTAKYTAGGYTMTLADSSKLACLPGKSNGSYTLAAWVKPANGSDGGNIFEWGEYDNGSSGWCRKLLFGLGWNQSNSYMVYNSHNAGDDVRCYMKESDPTTPEDGGVLWTAADSPAGWHHLALVCAPNRRKFFFDGRLMYTAEKGSSSINVSQVAFHMGALNGGLDEVMMFNDALADAEIPLLMSGLGTPEPTTLDVADGASVTVTGALALKKGAVDGMIAADSIVLAEKVELEMSFSSLPATARLTGAFTLPAALTMTFDTAAENRYATFPLFAGTGLDAAETEDWTVKTRLDGASAQTRVTRFPFAGGLLSVELLKRGSLLILR